MLKLLHDYALHIPFFLALLTMLLRGVSRLAAPHPRARAVVEAFAAASPDVLRAFGELYRAATGRDLPLPSIDARDAEIARQRDVIAAQAARLQELGAADLRARDPLSRGMSPPVPPVALGLVVLLGALGCASGPRSTDATVTAILSGTRLAQAAACSRGADTFLGPLQEPSTQLPATRTPATLTTFIRAWLCADPLGAILDTVTELLAPTPASTPSTRTSTTPTPPPVTPSSEPVTHAPEPVTHAPELVTHAPEPVTQPPAPVAQTQDGGTP